MIPAARSTLRRSRALAALVLGLFALGWLGDRFHVTFESHRWCSEHGRPEHGGANHVQAQDLASTAAERCGVPEVAAGEAGEHHACCVLLARGENPATLVHPPAEGAGFVADSTRARIAPDSWSPHHAVPLLLLAPKLSPPRA